MVADTSEWSGRLRKTGFHKTTGGNVVPVFSITIDVDEVREFTEYLFIRAVFSYAVVASILGVHIRDFAKRPHHGKSSGLHKKAYRLFSKAFGHILVTVKNDEQISRFYKIGLVLSDGHVMNRKTIQFNSSRQELVAIILKAFRKAKVYIGYPVLLKNGVTHPYVTLHVENKLGTRESMLNELSNAKPPQLIEYIAGLADGDGSVHVRNGIKIAVSHKNLSLIEPVRWMGMLQRHGQNMYWFSIYKEFQKAVLSKMLYREKTQKLRKVLGKKYRKHRFNGITFTYDERQPWIRFHGDIQKILEYAEKLGLKKPRIRHFTAEFPNPEDAVKLLKTLISLHREKGQQ